MRQPAVKRCATPVRTRPELAGYARGIAASADICPVRWAGRRAVVTIPERVDVSNAGQIRDELLAVINGGARVLIADMTATASRDHAGADAVVWAYQRGVTGGTELRLVVTAQIVSRVLGISGMDRLVSIYPSLKAATAAQSAAAALAPVGGPAGTGTNGQPPPHSAGRAGRSAPATGPGDGHRAGSTPAVIGELAGPLRDGGALADGRTLAGGVPGHGR
jgi:anti-sigma B factor antagonist